MRPLGTMCSDTKLLAKCSELKNEYNSTPDVLWYGVTVCLNNCCPHNQYSTCRASALLSLFVPGTYYLRTALVPLHYHNTVVVSLTAGPTGCSLGARMFICIRTRSEILTQNHQIVKCSAPSTPWNVRQNKIGKTTECTCTRTCIR